MTRGVAAAAALVVAASVDAAPTDVETTFHDFMKAHSRDYAHGSPEYAHRLDVFRRRLEEIEAQNNDPQRTWDAGVNHFADRTDDERSMLLGYKPSRRDGGEEAPEGELADSGVAMEEMNWKNLSIALTIPDQGSCGSCWAVTTASVLDAHHEIYVAKGMRFSAQELVSCVKNPQHCGGKGGCDGATVELGMDYALKSGLASLTKVPYKGKDEPCGTVTMPVLAEGQGHDNNKGHAFGLVGWKMLPRNKEAPLLNALMTKGPVAISVAATKWFAYHSGIFNKCPKDVVVDHAVTLYGYGKSGSQRYWLIRNSWGAHWGEAGFIRMVRSENEDAYCGWDSDAQKGTACDNDPKKVKVCGSCGILYDNVVPTFDKAKITKFFKGHSKEKDDDDDSLVQDHGMKPVQRHVEPLVRREG